MGALGAVRTATLDARHSTLNTQQERATSGETRGGRVCGECEQEWEWADRTKMDAASDPNDYWEGVGGSQAL